MVVTTPLQWKGPTSVGSTADDERTPDIVQLANGNYLVVYAGTNAAGAGSPSGSDILGQIYSVMGVPIGGIIRLNTLVSVDDEISPSVAALPGGGFVVTFLDFEVTNGIPITIDTNVRIEVYDNSGTFLRGTNLFDAPANALQVAPEIAVSSNTNALIVWEDSSSGDVVARLYNPTTNLQIGGGLTVFGGATGTGESIRGTAVTVLNNGSYVVAWGNENGATNDSVQFRTITTAGVQGSLVTVADGLAENYDPSLAALSNGNFVISWTADGSGGSNTGVRFKVFNATGGAVSGELSPLTTTAGNQWHSAVAATDTGFIVFWADEAEVDIRGQRYTNAGVKVGVEFTVLNNGVTQLTSLQATTLEDGRVALAWTANGSSDDTAQHAIWDPRDLPNAPDSNGFVVGTPQDDSFTVGAGAVFVYGQNGNDTIIVTAADVDPALLFDGGTGSDTLQLAAGSGTWNFEGELLESFETLRFHSFALGSLSSQSQTLQLFASQLAPVTTIGFGTGGFNNASTLRITMGSTTTLDLSGRSITGFTGGSTGPFLSLGIDRIEINGDSSTETITGTTVDDVIFGGVGNDTLNGNAGNDTIEGGAGADSLTGGTGTNTLSYSGAVAAVSVSLLGSIAAGGDAAGDVFTGFVNLTGGAGSDTLTGDTTGNVLTGNGGADSLNGGSGEDTIYGGAANDTLTGGSDEDILYGGDQNDLLNGSGGIDVIYGGEGDDTILSIFGDFTDDVYGGGGSDTYDASGNTVLAFTIDLAAQTFTNGGGGGTRAIQSVERLIGTQFDDDFTGSAVNETMTGGAGNDTLDGGAGNDSLAGGLGNDLYVVDSYSDVVTELAGEGSDEISSSLSAYSIFGNAHIEILSTSLNTGATLTGNAGDNEILGLGGNDRLIGSGGNDSLVGGGGDDTLEGGSGANTLVGGLGNDTHVVSSFSDVVTEVLNEGTDTVQTALGAYSIFTKANIENITSTTGAGVTLTGNSGNNVLTGSTGNDTLIGSAGNDTLAGAAGADSLDGGAGNDVYIVDSYGDVVTEFAGNGTDTIHTTLSAYSIFGNANVEYLVGLSGAGHTLTGNAGDNALLGNSGNDRLVGSGGNDVLTGAGGNDTLEGGTGTNTLDGGIGDDVYIVSSFTDVLTEGVGAGTDTVETALGAFSIFTKANIENITSTTTSGVTLTGNSLANALTGNSGNDTLIGSSGNDTLAGTAGNDSLDGGGDADVLAGGAGADVLVGGAGADAFVFLAAPATGVDTIADFSGVDDTIHLDDAAFAGLGALGALGAARFVTGTAATTAAHRVIYDSAQGDLYFDADGTGAAARVLFAELTPGTALTSLDFLVI